MKRAALLFCLLLFALTAIGCAHHERDLIANPDATPAPTPTPDVLTAQSEAQWERDK